MSQYKTGTVAVTNGSSVITGTSTAWLTSGIDASDFFIAAGDVVAYTIASIDSDTQITLTANYAGSTQSGITYTAHIERFGALPIFSDNDADTPELMNEVVKFTVNQDSALGTASTKDTGTAAGEVPLNSDLGTASLVDAIGSGDLYGRDSILGTVSETAGVPTGAIIESGSNSEGEYTKFADGTMTQFGKITLSVPFTQEEGGFYRNIATDLRITLPQTFSGAIADYAASVYVGGAAFQSDAGEIIGLQQIEHESTGELKVLFINQTSNTATLTFGFSAIGRWFN